MVGGSSNLLYSLKWDDVAPPFISPPPHFRMFNKPPFSIIQSQNISIHLYHPHKGKLEGNAYNSEMTNVSLPSSGWEMGKSSRLVLCVCRPSLPLVEIDNHPEETTFIGVTLVLKQNPKHQTDITPIEKPAASKLNPFELNLGPQKALPFPGTQILAVDVCELHVAPL